MKKKIIIAIFTIFILVAIVLVIALNYKQTNSDSIKFKNEYESLNNTYDEQRKHDYVSVKIDSNNPIKYTDYDEIVDLLTNGTGIIYFGFPECPWCRNAVPVLFDAANELGIDKIYYYNALSIRDAKSLDENGNIVTDKEGTKEYNQLIKLMYDKLPVYEGLNDDTIKRLYFPTVVFVKEGKIIDLHSSTVDSQKDPYTALTNEEYSELKQIYTDGINNIYDILCDQSC